MDNSYEERSRMLRRRKRQGRNQFRKKCKAFLIAGSISLCILFLFIVIVSRFNDDNDGFTATFAKGNETSKDMSEDGSEEALENADRPEDDVNPPGVVVDYLRPNKYSRSCKALDKVKGIVVHYTANPGTDAKANRDYFDGLAQSGETYASSHFVIGLDGTVIQCIPLSEMSYASNDRNEDTISIECCHPGKDGKFTNETYKALVKLTAWLCDYYKLSSDDIIRHYDVTGKMCPKYFVDHEDKWKKFRKDVKKKLK